MQMPAQHLTETLHMKLFFGGHERYEEVDLCSLNHSNGYDGLLTPPVRADWIPIVFLNEKTIFILVFFNK